MPIWSPAFFGSAGSSGYVVEDSIWLDGSSDYLTFDPSGASSTPDLYCISFWAKRSAALGGTNVNVIAGGANGLEDILRYKTDALEFTINGGGGGEIQTNAVFRDPTAWHHVFVRYDSANGTAGDRMQMFVNGAEVTSFATDSNPSSGLDSNLLDGALIAIGAYPDGSQNFNGYLAEFIVLDGYGGSATDFGEYDDNGVWIPVNPTSVVSSNKGTNGFYLDFAVAPGTGNGAGTDVSGNGNHFTDNSMTAAQQVTDTCSDDADNNVGNYPTWSPIDKDSNVTVSSGNTVAEQDSTASFKSVLATQAVPSTGKWVWEIKQTVSSFVGDGYATTGVASTNVARSIGRSGSGSITFDYQSGTSKIRKFGGGDSDYATSVSLTNTNFTIQFAVDSDAEELKLFVGNSQVGTTLDISSLTKPYKIISQIYSGGNVDHTLVTNSADFVNNVPSGYKTIYTANLPTPTVKDPSEFFKTVEFSGTGSAQNIDTVGFRPDLLIIKSRTSTSNFNWVDSVRGASEILWSNAEVAQSEETTSVTGFRDAGFSVGSDSGSYVNISGQTMMAFCLKAGGSTTSSNTDGTITSEVTAASHGGFSIAKYTGTGANATFGHGCSRAPKFILVRAYEQGYSWTAWHEGLTSGDYVIFLSGSAAESNQGGGAWQSTPPSSSVVTLGSQTGQNGSGQVHVCYSFARTPGLIGIGNYTGNGSADGPMIVVEDGGSGFKPAWLMVKRANNTDDWKVSNSVMSPFNPVLTNSNLNINTSAAADTPSGPIDYFANGFSPRLANGPWNASGDNYIYLAFGEHPFGGDTVAQAKAR